MLIHSLESMLFSMMERRLTMEGKMDKVKKSALVRSVLTPLDESHQFERRRELTFFSRML